MGKNLTFKEPGCSLCEHYKDLHFGNRYCLGFGRKKPNGRRFKTRDPKYKAPKWCPKRNIPAIVRVYRMTDEARERNLVLELWARDNMPGEAAALSLPFRSHYALVAECRESLTAGRFHEIAARSSDEAAKNIGFPLKYNDVVEIDDGLRPHAFHYRAEGWKNIFW